MFAPKIIYISRIIKGEEGAEEEGAPGKGPKVMYGLPTEDDDEDSSGESAVGGDGGVQFFSDNVIRRSGGTSQASTDSEMGRRPSRTGSSIGG